MSCEIVYSIDDTEYQRWQADMLDWSARRCGMDCGISRLTTLAPDRGTYACLNRFHSIIEQWTPSDAETIILLDPDMVFLRKMEPDAMRGVLWGRPYSYVYNLSWVPLILHRDDLKNWARASLPVARAIYSSGGGWISEMWAGSIGAQMTKMQYRQENLAVCNCDRELSDDPMVHYCYDVGGFNKQKFRPGDTLHIREDTEVQRALIPLVNEFSSLRRR